MNSTSFLVWNCASFGHALTKCRTVRLGMWLFLLTAIASTPIHAQYTTESGLNDLVILDPAQHERGLPAVILTYMNDHPEVAIPPTVHVHRYYYSGDKVFQGPILQGGPIVLVAGHPKTGCQMYINVVLPPGAPRIAHTKNSIRYLYGDKRVEVKFQHFPFDPCVAVVKHHSGKGMGVAIRDRSELVQEHVHESLQNSETVNAVRDLAAGGHNLVKGAAATIGTMSTRGADGIKQLAKMIPGVTYLSSKAEQMPQQKYESTLRVAERQQEIDEPPFVRTNR